MKITHTSGVQFGIVFIQDRNIQMHLRVRVAAPEEDESIFTFMMENNIIDSSVDTKLETGSFICGNIGISIDMFSTTSFNHQSSSARFAHSQFVVA